MRIESSQSRPRPVSFIDRGRRAGLARTSRGVSLIEVIVFIVVVSAAVAGLLSSLGTVVQGSADPVVRKQALAAAESLLEEILARDFANPAGGFSGAATQANRPQFDDVSDYNGFATTGIHSIDGGTPLTGLENYPVQATVGAAAVAFPGVPGADVRQVTVTVTTPGGEAVALTSYRFRYE